MLAVAFPAGVAKLRLSFRPRSAIAGAVASLVALVIAVGFARRGGRREASPIWQHEGRWLLVAAGVPLTLLAIVYAVIREPLASPPPLRAPSGEPVLAPTVPAGALRVDASFGRNLVLDAVRPPEPPNTVPGDSHHRRAGLARRRPAFRRPRSGRFSGVEGDRPGRVGSPAHLCRAPVLRRATGNHPPRHRSVPVSGGPSGVDIDVWVGVREGGSHRALSVSATDKATRGDGRVLVTSIKSP